MRYAHSKALSRSLALAVISSSCGGDNGQEPPDGYVEPVVDSVILRPMGDEQEGLPTLSAQPIRMHATLLDSAGHVVSGPYLTWSTSGDDRVAKAEARDSNIWTVRGAPEVHTITARVRDNLEVGDSYHVRVFSKKLQLQLVDALIPKDMTVGESAPLRVRVVTAEGVPVLGVDVLFRMEVVGWHPCGQYDPSCGPPLAGTTLPADGWVGGGNEWIQWVRTNSAGEAAGLFTAMTGLFSLESSIQFDVHPVIHNVPGTLSVGDTIFERSTLHAGAATQIVDDGGQPQSGHVGATLDWPFWVKVRDRYGNVVENEPVTWTVLVGGGSLVWQSRLTSTYGRAGARLVLGPEPGPQSVQASIAAGASVTFTAAAIP